MDVVCNEPPDKLPWMNNIESLTKWDLDKMFASCSPDYDIYIEERFLFGENIPKKRYQ